VCHCFLVLPVVNIKLKGYSRLSAGGSNFAGLNLALPDGVGNTLSL